jgi:nitrate reductase gamma subunit
VRWTVFTVYHVGILAAIGATFTIPFLPRLMTEPVRWVFAISIGLAFIGGWLKLAWRLMKPEIRIISTPDDYFSLLVLQVWFFVAIPAILWEPHGWLVTYFVMTALLLIYVPLSKISHYIYWFFSRYFFGVRYGNRGVF